LVIAVQSESRFPAEAHEVLNAVLALEPQIRAAADAIEAERCLPLALVQALKKPVSSAWPSRAAMEDWSLSFRVK
jgi:hypothetical protein